MGRDTVNVVEPSRRGSRTRRQDKKKWGEEGRVHKGTCEDRGRGTVKYGQWRQFGSAYKTLTRDDTMFLTKIRSLGTLIPSAFVRRKASRVPRGENRVSFTSYSRENTSKHVTS